MHQRTLREIEEESSYVIPLILYDPFRHNVVYAAFSAAFIAASSALCGQSLTWSQARSKAAASL